MKVVFAFPSKICRDDSENAIPPVGLMSYIFTQMQKYFLDLKNSMPSMSPVDKNWPARPYIFLDGVHKELQKIFHLWRVGHYCFCAPHRHVH